MNPNATDCRSPTLAELKESAKLAFEHVQAHVSKDDVTFSSDYYQVVVLIARPNCPNCQGTPQARPHHFLVTWGVSLLPESPFNATDIQVNRHYFSHKVVAQVNEGYARVLDVTKYG